MIATQSLPISNSSVDWALVSTRGEHQGTRTWIADIAENGTDFLVDKVIISEFLAHKKFTIRFTSASGMSIIDKYSIGGLSIDSLRVDCPAFFKRRQSFHRSSLVIEESADQDRW
jgi:hypothetical protein